MGYSCGNFIQNENGTKFFIGNKVRVYKKGEWQFRGTITHITCKGIYLDCGAKKAKYFRADELDEIGAEE